MKVVAHQDTWDPAQYERFRAERSQPFFDLLGLVARVPGMRVVDLGAGTGEWTRHLHVTLGAATTLGLDRSDAMLASASKLDASPVASTGLSFAKGDIGAWCAEDHEARDGYDLIFSNAALHWVRSHETLLAGLTRALRPRGQLAVQVPANFDHPTHRIASALAREPEFAIELAGPHVLPPEAYATLLHRLGYVEQHVRLQVYAHALPSRADVVEWVKGTTLTEVQARLSQRQFESFLRQYRERLYAVLPDERPFFYPFKRILFWART